jgi:hypothetical protein
MSFVEFDARRARIPEWITAKYAKCAKTEWPLFAYFEYFAVKMLFLAPFVPFCGEFNGSD